MNELIVVAKIAECQRLEALVLDSVSSPITRRVYNMALDEFIAWYRLGPRPGFTKATVSAWRVSLEARGLGSSSIIIRMSAIRKLAVEAADNWLIAPELAAGIARVKSAKSIGIRVGNWLTLRPTPAPLLKPTVSEAVERFLGSYGEIDRNGRFRGDVEQSTYRKYEGSLRGLKSLCDQHHISLLVEVGDVLEDFRPSRNIGSVTWKVERQTLVTFFGYCVKRGWITTNPAKELKTPRNLKPNEVVPYTLQEESQILAACDRIGGGKYNRSGARYEQLRARAMVMLHRHTALRILTWLHLGKMRSRGTKTIGRGASGCAHKKAGSLFTSRFRTP